MWVDTEVLISACAGSNDSAAMSHNTWIHRLVRPVVKPLVGLPITPNQLTTLRLTFGLSASVACMVGGQTWLGIGGALFVVAHLLDRADGIFARLSGKTSRFGHRYDLVSDAISNAIIFVGIGVGLRDGPLGWWTALLGLVAGLAVLAIVGLVVEVEGREGERAAELPNMAGFDPDDGMLAVPVLIWLGLSLPLLYLAASITPVFAVFFAWKHRRFLRRPLS
jgi:phosphatidylglycerophosphate synthase